MSTQLDELKMGLFQQMLKPGHIVIDAGACVGKYTEVFERLVAPNGKVIAFEPESKNFRTLSSKFSNSNIVTCIKASLMEQEGDGYLFVHHREEWHSMYSIHNDTIGKELVDIVTIDGYCSRNNILQVDLIKVDVEGCEEYLLMGAKDILSKNNPMVLTFDIHERFGVNLSNIFNILTSYKFIIIDIFTGNAITSPKNITEEILVVR